MIRPFLLVGRVVLIRQILSVFIQLIYNNERTTCIIAVVVKNPGKLSALLRFSPSSSCILLIICYIILQLKIL